jgi:hypothetical protein
MFANARTPQTPHAKLHQRWWVSACETGIAMPESSESFIKAEKAGYTWERRSPLPEDDHVLGHTDNWLNALPVGVRPVHLQQEFPRIANDLARLWAETPALDLYFEEKEFSPREGRVGFPPIIKEELLAMHVYSLRNRPVRYEEQALMHAIHKAAILS